jgi:predicted amidohydrolase YtcJ
MIFTNARVVTCDPSQPRAEAVGVREGRIRAVGDAESVRAAMGRDVVEIDAGGRTVLPGLIDAHNHMLSTAEMFAAINVRYPEVRSIADLVSAIDAAAERTPPGRWIRGFGMSFARYPEGRPPTRWDLDRATSEHPVIILHHSGHIVLSNSRALAERGVGDNVLDPDGGSVVRDAAGRPTGMFHDAATNLVLPLAVDIGCHGPNFHFETPLDDLVAQLEAGVRRYLAAGLTTVCDPQVTRRELIAYRAARERDALGIRTVLMPLSHQLDELVALGLAGPFGDDWLRIGAMKFYADGAGRTAVFSEPYGPADQYRPTYFHQPEALAALVCRAHEAGWQVGIHTIGDRALDASLDAIEGALRALPRDDARHRIEHCSNPTPAHLRRIASVGAIPVSQPCFISEIGDLMLQNLGERAHATKPLRSALDLGVPVVISSDSYVVSYRPLDTIAAAVLRRTPQGQTIGPAQALTVEEAIRAHTIDAARALRMEDRLGSLEPGKLADLAIIDGDLLATPPDRIAGLGIWMTVLAGRIAYAADDTIGGGLPAL